MNDRLSKAIGQFGTVSRRVQPERNTGRAKLLFRPEREPWHMLPATLPADETERLRAIKAAGLLDTPATPEIDRLTRLAARVFRADIALVTLIDAQRQWFKSKVGLDLSETARNISFCAHCMLSDEAFVVLDALADPRFHDNPLVIGAPTIRFYAGAPIKIGGFRSGSFAVLGLRPRRSFSEEERQNLKDFAAVAERELDLIRRSAESGRIACQ